MSAAGLFSYLCAALAAFGNAIANVMQRKASLQSEPDTLFGARVMVALLRNRTWVLGFLGMVGSFVLQAVALGLGELASVEPIITLEVPLTLLVASRVFGIRVGTQEWAAILVMTGGMIALVAGLNPQPGDASNINHFTYVVAGGGTAATIAILVLGSRHRNTIWKTACLGAAAGTSFGLTATLIKETVTQLTRHGIGGMLTTWQTYAAVGFGLLGVLVMQWALHTGPLLAAQPGFTLMDPLVSILWGVLVYDEITRTGGWLLLASAGGIGVGVGVALLARSPLFDTTAANSPEITQINAQTNQG